MTQPARNIETELKLRLSSSDAQSLPGHPLWKNYTKKTPILISMGNTYFDTSDFQLSQAKIALRIRHKDNKWLQTLKTLDQSLDGLSRRKEWEWGINGPSLDLKRLQEILPEYRSLFYPDKLIPLFTTDFIRTCWTIQWPAPMATIEAALDIGNISAGTKHDPICELELELLKGEEQALTDFSRKLQQHIPLHPFDRSKAERGYALYKTAQ
ncbi:Inorganic triphosphatase [invertebrate metagenome]|uniref:Inorganic triphosphatase n=1 Tax=invertebrate metagenome TaxID=1711999 RepID=A0A2H9T7A1_9ZZZZ